MLLYALHFDTIMSKLQKRMMKAEDRVEVKANTLKLLNTKWKSV